MKEYQPGFWKRNWIKFLCSAVAVSSIFGCGSLEGNRFAEAVPNKNTTEQKADKKSDWYTVERNRKLAPVHNDLLINGLVEKNKKLTKLEDFAGKLKKIEIAEKAKDVDSINSILDSILKYKDEKFINGIEQYFPVDDYKINKENKALFKEFVAKDLEVHIENAIKCGFDRSMRFFNQYNDDKTIDFIDLIDKISNLLPKKYEITKTVEEIVENKKETKQVKEKVSLLKYGEYLYDKIKKDNILEEGRTIEAEGLTIPLYQSLDILIDGKIRTGKDTKKPLLNFYNTEESKEADHQKMVQILSYAKNILNRAGFLSDKGYKDLKEASSEDCTNVIAVYSFLVKKLINKKLGRVEQTTLSDEVKEKSKEADKKSAEEKSKEKKSEQPKKTAYELAVEAFDKRIEEWYKDYKEEKKEILIGNVKEEAFIKDYDTLEKASQDKLSDALVKARLDAAKAIKTDLYRESADEKKFTVSKSTLEAYKNFKSNLETQPNETQTGENK